MRLPAEIVAPTTSEPVKLSKKDKEIISILGLNSRTQLSQIADVLGTSTEVVSYHYSALRKKHILTDTFAAIETKLLGIHRYCVYMQVQAVSQDEMRVIIQQLLLIPHLNWLIETGGKWELVVMFETTSEERFDAALAEVLLPVKAFLSDFMVSVVKSFMHKGPQYVSGVHRKEEYKGVAFPYEKEFQAAKDSMLDVDAHDLDILLALTNDARVTLTELGAHTGLSRDVVDDRIRKLIRAGVIKNFTSRLNYYLLRKQYFNVLIKLRGVTPQRKQEFLAHVNEDERFYARMEQIGPWDLSLFMFFDGARDLRDFLIALKERFSDVIASHDSVIHFDQHFYSYLAPGIVKELRAKLAK